MAYQVIARKWRPRIFADVVGQQHIIKTLQNELLQERMAHAYLFVGPRGIGKTTIARIFAKAMNCHKAPVADPCCECPSCKAIADGNSLDLIEIDGASNNTVEDIRQLREEVMYSPVSSKFKVYIIDEVHMLSSSAWNALLKTIEEPPAHAKFIFATTEAHKVLPTVVSRCQRFDLQRITFKLISEQLKKIASSENINIADDAIEVIARAADGGMRDAQSLLDQMIAFTSEEQGNITAEQVLVIFGLTGVAEMEKLILSIVQNDKPGLISTIHQLAGQGKNLEKLFEDILLFLRGIQICLIVDDPASILETGDDMIQFYKRVGAVTNADVIQKLLEFLSPVGRLLHDALNKQVFLETILLKGMRIAHAVEIESLIVRLNQLRGEDLKILDKIPSMAQERSVPLVSSSLLPPISEPALSPKPAPTSSSESVSKLSVEKMAEPSTERPATAQTSSPSATVELSSSDDASKKSDNSSSLTDELPQTEKANRSPLLLTPKKQEEMDADTSQKASLTSKRSIANVKKNESSPESVWHSLMLEMEHCRQPMLKAYMQNGRPESLISGTLTVVYDEDSEQFYVTELQKEKHLLELKLKRITGIEGAVLNLVSKKGVTSPREAIHKRVEDMAEVRKRMENNQFVKDTIDLFNAEIIDVRG